MSANIYAATADGDAPLAQDLGVTRWVDAGGQPLATYGLGQMGDGYKLVFCFQHNCPGCHRTGFPALARLVHGLRARNVRFAAVQTVFEDPELNTYESTLRNQLQYALPIPFGFDDGDGKGSVLMQRYGDLGTPWFILIDPAGSVIHNHFHIDVDKTIAIVVRATEASTTASTPGSPANAAPALNWADVIRWANHGNPAPPHRVEKTDAEWRAQLTEDQYRITREKGTERAHSSDYCVLFAPGIYRCVSCDTPLFSNDNKFRSRSGWPSFTQPLNQGLIAYRQDDSYGMRRIEAECHVCDAHLGHVFPDGPEPTGLRYCINAIALRRDDLITTEEKN